MVAGVLLVGLVAGGALLWRSLPDVRQLATRPPRSTAFIDLRRQEAQQAGRRFVLRWTWRSLAQISPYLQEAVVLSEDARFWTHEGVDWDAMEQAAEKNWQKRRIAMGGSTITQQLAKNLYLSPSKDPLRKLRELLIAQRLDRQLSKERILELYLNVVEWGDGVFGAEAAARRWYGSSANELTPAQAARLAVALPSPRRRTPEARSAGLDRKAARLVRVMWRGKVIDDVTRDRALADLGQAVAVGADATAPAPVFEPELAAPDTATEATPDTGPPPLPATSPVY
jgi:monofunctional glycosyltransferase